MTQRISVEEYRTRLAVGSKRTRKSKHNNTKVGCDGHVFDSKAEMRRYLDLRILQRAGKIRDLVLQPEISIPTGLYRADFKYRDCNGVLRWEDVKGMNTPACRLKLKMVAQLGVLIELITQRSHPRYFSRTGTT